MLSLGLLPHTWVCLIILNASSFPWQWIPAFMKFCLDNPLSLAFSWPFPFYLQLSALPTCNDSPCTMAWQHIYPLPLLKDPTPPFQAAAREYAIMVYISTEWQFQCPICQAPNWWSDIRPRHQQEMRPYHSSCVGTEYPPNVVLTQPFNSICLEPGAHPGMEPD